MENAVEKNVNNKNSDKRRIKSRLKIKEAFVSVHTRSGFDGLTVSAVCKEAGISRATFYSHYKNVNEVLDEILDEAFTGIDRFWPQYLNIDIKIEDLSKPFCIFVRESKKYRSIFLDDAFSSLIVKKLTDRSYDLCHKYLKARSDLSLHQIKALINFQVSGCLAITKMGIREGIDEWNCVKCCVDDFIKSGIDSVLKRGSDK